MALTKSMVLLNNSQNDEYNCDLIHLFLDVSYKSTLAYITSVSLFSWIFYQYIPLTLFSLIVGAHIFYQIIRLYYVQKYKSSFFSQELKQIFLRQHTGLMVFGSVIWGLSCYAVVLYAPLNYEYIMLFFVITLSAGSISTLSGIYRTYVAYNLPLIIICMLSFIYRIDNFHIYVLIVLPIFAYVLFSASWQMHTSLKRSMELKDLYAQSQDELTEVNSSLEERVAQAVHENRQKDKQMLEQSRLAQMGEMLSMIAHQWRQPLSAITATTGSISLHLQLDKCDEAYIEENIQKVNTFTQYLSSTITDFRNFFKPDKAKSLSSLNAIVLGSLKIIGTSLQAQGVHVETFLESKDEFLSYPNELKQVVLNILKNAQDALSEKKVKDARIVIKTMSTDEDVQLSVCDTAGGIDEDEIKYIFDPYYTTKEQRDGTGLGLYMSKMIVEDNCGGQIEVRNEDEGACFRITLPRT